ncbi:uncharacterized protein MONBRDRAFT_19302 [Monosiga brevicollis MX1]|uniref:Delta-1-pyrroline-5-carboxylate synthase n=1 Tax=Monosiga brevicollis TaxID=81824 RepID=A9UQJ5_MONBE|nr:uncharacterized protein MONBRDRAFT_19302 [Monosiga brevicollis MX1]EDQ93056.1 predicted protein [Monosiga brevicollis MX1]|eukprot:XP_001742818.1 hypothetical protein [Monosiga brevicollis MX1]
MLLKALSSAFTAAPRRSVLASPSVLAIRNLHRVKHRSEIADPRKCNRVVIKLGSAVITRTDEYGLALGRLASIIEEVAELQRQGREVILVTSGAVAFGRQLLAQQDALSRSIRQTLKKGTFGSGIDPRACSAAGQGGLVSLYQAMFSQYGITCAQVLVTKNDFRDRRTLTHLNETMNALLNIDVVPIINENDAVSPPAEDGADLDGVISVVDNDSLASNIANQMEADLMLLLSDVEGIYNGPPKKAGSRLLERFAPNELDDISFGAGSKVGRGGMKAKVGAACWAWHKGVGVVIANGMRPHVISEILQGKRVGTFFTDAISKSTDIETVAKSVRQGGRDLSVLPAQSRREIIERLADLLVEREKDIMAANRRDVEEARENNTSTALLNRLSLTPAKLQSLAAGLRQIAGDADHHLGRVVKRTQLADDLLLQQETVPIGVLMVIFESRPDCLPQVASLAIASGNGLLLKGGKEASRSNRVLYSLVREALSLHANPDTVSLVESRDDVSALLELDGYIDLIIPRGSNDLVRSITEQANGVPVMGHADGVCHVYLDAEADPEKALRVIIDAKTDYPAACNAMETLLVHKDLVESPTFKSIVTDLRNAGVKINMGPRLFDAIGISGKPQTDFHIEYGEPECTIEIVDDVDAAIKHIHANGSSHTEVILTENQDTAKRFLSSIDSACVFHNASSRFADGYRFGLGAEVGISTSRIHARGPVGVEGLLTTKWKLYGDGQTAKDFSSGEKTFLHQSLPLQE